jgi:hypothetical protein
LSPKAWCEFINLPSDVWFGAPIGPTRDDLEGQFISRESRVTFLGTFGPMVGTSSSKEFTPTWLRQKLARRHSGAQ